MSPDAIALLALVALPAALAVAALGVSVWRQSRRPPEPDLLAFGPPPDRTVPRYPAQHSDGSF
jgi:hypothetical protein